MAFQPPRCSGQKSFPHIHQLILPYLASMFSQNSSPSHQLHRYHPIPSNHFLLPALLHEFSAWAPCVYFWTLRTSVPSITARVILFEHKSGHVTPLPKTFNGLYHLSQIMGKILTTAYRVLHCLSQFHLCYSPASLCSPAVPHREQACSFFRAFALSLTWTTLPRISARLNSSPPLDLCSNVIA